MQLPGNSKSNNIIGSDAQLNTNSETDDTIRVGVSACLLGHQVRFNGGHGQSRLCLDTLSQYFEFKPFCPEVAGGFGTPRPTMKLIGTADSPMLTWSKAEGEDLTERVVSGFQQELAVAETLDGYILMAKSPSCGLHRVKVYQLGDHSHQSHGRGLYAAALQKRYPLLPMEDEGRLQDPHLRENFILRVYAYHNFKKEVLSDLSVASLLKFHRSYKYILMAHKQSAYKQLGQMLAEGGCVAIEKLWSDYLVIFMDALSKPTNSGNHTNTLLHILGYLKKLISPEARQNIASTILCYRRGELPLVTPLTLLNHYIQLHGSEYIREQRYLQPYPQKLGLANLI